MVDGALDLIKGTVPQVVGAAEGIAQRNQDCTNDLYKTEMNSLAKEVERQDSTFESRSESFDRMDRIRQEQHENRMEAIKIWAEILKPYIEPVVYVGLACFAFRKLCMPISTK